MTGTDDKLKGAKVLSPHKKNQEKLRKTDGEQAREEKRLEQLKVCSVYMPELCRNAMTSSGMETHGCGLYLDKITR